MEDQATIANDVKSDLVALIPALAILHTKKEGFMFRVVVGMGMTEEWGCPPNEGTTPSPVM